MPPLPRLKVAALAELAKQLRFEPAKAARRQLENAEKLARDIAPGKTYAEDWVLRRITGYRPDIAEPGQIVGEALLADLSALVERLCIAAGLREEDLTAENGRSAWLDAPAVCSRWKISRATLDRYRRQGLLSRRVIARAESGEASTGKNSRARSGPQSGKGGIARQKLLFSVSAVEAFESAHADRLREAGGFTRMGPEIEATIVRRARRYRKSMGLSLNQAARRLATRFERSHEAVRQLLRRHDATAARPIFDGHKGAPNTSVTRDPQRRSLEARFAAGRGASARALARSAGRTPGAVYRSLSARRAARLRALHLVDEESPASPTFERDDAESVLLSPEPVRTGLGDPGARTLEQLLDAARSGPTLMGAVERGRAVAYWFLRRRAAMLIEALPRHGAGAIALDEIETRLRWAARLKAELVRSQLPLAIKTLEGRLGRELISLPAGGAEGSAALVLRTVAALIESADRFDPFKGGRLSAPAGLAVTREVSMWVKARTGKDAGSKPASGIARAQPRVDPAAIILDDWTRRVCDWQAWLEPDENLQLRIAEAPEPGRSVVMRRYGWHGGPPQTCREIASGMRVTAAQVSRLERKTARAVLGEVTVADA